APRRRSPGPPSAVIEHGGDRHCCAARKTSAQPREARAVLARSHDEERALGERGEHLEVRSALRRWRVDQDHAEATRGGFQEMPQPLAREELQWIFPHGAGGKEREGFASRGKLHITPVQE